MNDFKHLIESIVVFLLIIFGAVTCLAIGFFLFFASSDTQLYLAWLLRLFSFLAVILSLGILYGFRNYTPKKIKLKEKQRLRTEEEKLAKRQAIEAEMKRLDQERRSVYKDQIGAWELDFIGLIVLGITGLLLVFMGSYILLNNGTFEEGLILVIPGLIIILPLVWSLDIQGKRVSPLEFLSFQVVKFFVVSTKWILSLIIVYGLGSRLLGSLSFGRYEGMSAEDWADEYDYENARYNSLKDCIENYVDYSYYENDRSLKDRLDNIQNCY